MEKYISLVEKNISEVIKKLNQWRHEFDLEIVSHAINQTNEHYLIIKWIRKEE